MDKIEKMLADLTDANGVPGFEEEVAKVMVAHLEAASEITYDKLGSVIARKKGTAGTGFAGTFRNRQKRQ